MGDRQLSHLFFTIENVGGDLSGSDDAQITYALSQSVPVGGDRTWRKRAAGVEAEFPGHDAALVGAPRDADGAAAVVDQIVSAGGEAVTAQFDVADAETTTAAIEKLL